MFQGTYTALVTPFRDDANQSIDWAAFEVLVESQIEGGITGLIPCGTTGESPSLSWEEKSELVRRTVDLARGRVQVIAGTGTNSTRSTLDLSREAERLRVDGVMVVVPYYNKPTQEGLYRHFVTVASSVSCPVVVYNVPSRTGIDLTTETLVRICNDPRASNVRALKDATGNVLRAQETVGQLGDRISILSGDDSLTLGMIAVGARGVISVTSNLMPANVSRATRLALDGQLPDARCAHQALLPVYNAMFLESNPAPVKAALAMRGMMQATVRGPLTTVSETTRRMIERVLSSYKS